MVLWLKPRESSTLPGFSLNEHRYRQTYSIFTDFSPAKAGLFLFVGYPRVVYKVFILRNISKKACCPVPEGRLGGGENLALFFPGKRRP